MSTTTNLSTLKINYLTQTQYDTALSNNQINENEIYLTPNETVDLVVEQGTSGIWTYRKWSSGIAECWGSHSATISQLGGVLNGYSYSVAVDFPSNLFIDVPNVTYSAFLSNAYALTGTLNTSLTKNSVTLYAVSNTSGSKSSTWYIQVIGKWK